MDIPPLCPVDERRMPRKLYVKLVVVNITVLGAYGHLLNIRKEKFVIVRLLIMMLCPLGAVWHLLFPTAILFFRSLMHGMTMPSQASRQASWRDFALLFGRLSEGTSGTLRDQYIVWPPKSVMKVCRRQALQFFLLAQCIASIYLFHRRVVRDADVLYNHRILQLAICGFCTAIMTAIHITFQPSMPSQQRDGESWAYFYRNFDNTSDPEVQDYSRYLPSKIVRDGIILSLMAVIAWACHFKGGVGDLWEERYGLIRSLIVCFFILIILVLVFLVATPKKGGQIYDLLPLLGLLWADFLLVMFLCGHGVFFLDGISDYGSLFSGENQSIQSFALLPTDRPCPAAWKDSQADYLCWLA